MTDALLDMRVEVEQWFGVPPAEVWALLTDVPRMARLSPEVAEASWLGPPAQVGTTFAATNSRTAFQHGPGSSMVRQMIEVRGADPGETIAWRSQMLAEDMLSVLAAASRLAADRP